MPKISDLTSSTPGLDADLVPVVTAGVTKKITRGDLVQAHKSNIKGSSPYRTKGLTNWFTALETASTTVRNVVIIGDSISVTTAFGVTKPWGQRMAERFTDRGRTPIPAATWRFAYSTQVLGMTSCEGAIHSPVMGVGGVAMDLTTGQKATQTAVMDGISVVYSTFVGGGSLQVRDGVGGTLLTTIDTNAATKSSNIWTSSALSLTSRTIEITSVGSTILEGVYVHNGTRAAGVRVWTASKSGYTSQQFVDTPSLALDLLDTLQPELVIVATGTNDGAANYATYMANLLAAVASHAPTADIALWFPYSSSGGFPSSEETPARAYMETLTIPVIDGGIGTPNISTRYSSDGIHPTDEGAELIANHVYSTIGGDPIGQAVQYQSVLNNTVVALDTAKAPKADPTFTGTVTAPTITGSSGNSTLTAFFGAPYMTMKDTGNSAAQFTVASSTFHNALSGFNGVGFTLGSGSGAADVSLYRAAADSLKTDDKFTASLGLNMGTAGVGVPASASATGVKGDISFDASYIYICTATNTWKRVAIATW